MSAPVSPLTGPLISGPHLADLLATGSDVVLLDVRWRLGGPPGRADYDVAHLPGAVFVDLDTELADPPGPAGRHPLPEPQRWQATLRRAGVGQDSRVVVYDDGNGSIAARAWWLLRWAGFAPDRVAVLSGGWAAWVAAGLPTTAELARPVEGDVTVRPGAMPVLDADAAAELARTGVLLDARAAPRYRGEVEPVDPRAGHIPGARNLPAAEIAGPGGPVRPPAELARMLAERGVSADTPVGAYCGSGVTATALVLAAEAAGLRPPDAPMPVYVGSWSAWSADPARPAATGEEP